MKADDNQIMFQVYDAIESSLNEPLVYKDPDQLRQGLERNDQQALYDLYRLYGYCVRMLDSPGMNAFHRLFFKAVLKDDLKVADFIKDAALLISYLESYFDQAVFEKLCLFVLSHQGWEQEDGLLNGLFYMGFQSPVLVPRYTPLFQVYDKGNPNSAVARLIRLYMLSGENHGQLVYTPANGDFIVEDSEAEQVIVFTDHETPETQTIDLARARKERRSFENLLIHKPQGLIVKEDQVAGGFQRKYDQVILSQNLVGRVGQQTVSQVPSVFRLFSPIMPLVRPL
jgi:hypothetical protein